MRKRVLLVASTTGYQTRLFLDAAEALGCEAVLATDRCHVLEDPWGDRALALRFEDPQSCAEIAAGQPAIHGIIGLGDRPAYIAAVIAERLGIPFHPVAAVAACRDKYLTRCRFRSAGLPVPAFVRLACDTEPNLAALDIDYPCVLKPLGFSASRGVIRADNPSEFRAAFERVRALLESPEVRRLRDPRNEFIQVEKFIPGREFALEACVINGQLHPIALFDKPDPLDGPFFEETIYVTPSRAPGATQSAILNTTRQAVDALGLSNGPIHAEMRVNDEGVWMLEIAARPIGGLCARVLPHLPDMLLRQAVGGPLDTGAQTKAAAVMMIPIPRAGVLHEVHGEDQAREIPGLEDVIITAKPGQILVPLPEGNSYLGFIFARADTPSQAEAAVREAHAALSFEVIASLPVLA